jgi:hypothetical protein
MFRHDSGAAARMAKDTEHLAVKLGTENTGGLLTGFLAEEKEFDRHALWRLGSWGAVAVGAVVVASLANQSSLGQRRDQVAAADLSRQAAQLQLVARESQSETRRLASAVETLNTDRDRIYSRMTVLEEGLESVTGALARQNLAAASPQQAAAKPPASATAEASPTPSAQPASPPMVAPVLTTASIVTERPKIEVGGPAQPQPAPTQPQSDGIKVPTASSPQPQMPTMAPAAAVSLPKIMSNNGPASTPAEPLTAPKSMMGPPDPAASKLIEPAKAANPAPAASATPAAAAPEAAASGPTSTGEADSAEGTSVQVQRIEFAVDLGSANSVGGLRALWRGILKTNTELAKLRPIIVVRERSNGLGMQLRLAAGPLSDAAAAAKICAALTESDRGCETTVFDGQRLSLQAEDKSEPAPSPVAKPTSSRRSWQRRTRHEEPEAPAPAPTPKPDKPSTLSKLFGSK